MVSDKFYQKKKKKKYLQSLKHSVKTLVSILSMLILFVRSWVVGFFLLNRQNPLSLTKLFVDSPLKLEESKFLYYQSWSSTLKVQPE